MRISMPRVTPIVAAVCLSAAALASAPGPARAADQAVDISNFAFAPGVITITVGDTVTWTNRDDAPHTVTADDGAFDSGRIDAGQSWSMTFTRAGTFGYRCDFHSEMRGTVVVREARGGAQKPSKPTVQTAAGTNGGHANHGGAAAEDQPDTALSAPLPIGPATVSPALLMGLGLVVIAASIFRRPRRAPEALERPMGGWRR